MKKVITLLAFAFAITANAQTKDSTQKKDTVVIPLYEKQDTTAATILYLGKRKVVHYTKGLVIRKGFAMQKGKDNWQWAEQPKVIAVLDEKRNPIKYVIQIL